ncbi:MAG TPA: phosphatase PAP2 family protein [Terriglobia bacterium]|nr:phosphatase PAP2 family protein [Terriglobia bacterium]
MLVFRFAVIVSLVAGFCSSSLAQSPSEPSDFSRFAVPTAPEAPNPVARFLKTERALWTDPFKAGRKDAKWLVPLAIGTGALLATDRRSVEEVGEVKGISGISDGLSRSGSIAVYAGPAALWVAGRLFHDEKTQTTGIRTFEAVLHATTVTTVLKAVSRRERPMTGDGRGGFWDGGKSFPSGHTSTAFAFASALAGEYPDNRWIKWGAYGFATGVGLSRIGGLHHFPSDVLVGASLGYLIGHYVVRHDRYE